jgi:hypothetical protein
MKSDIKEFSVKSLLSSGDKYRIPMYQRNYAWDEGEITQLIQDIIDYQPGDKPYYVGTLVVYKRVENYVTVYETIDGQQRITTLSLLVSYLKNSAENDDINWYKQLIIDFESRQHSQKTFSVIFQNSFYTDPAEVLTTNETNSAILNGYRIIKKVLPIKLKENRLKIEKFSEYLFNKVTIMRVEVPHDTDLNHYFEIMNNRGEQLEKHEVLKSYLMKDLKNDEDKKIFHQVWEDSANMEKYIQAGFTPKQRHRLFGESDWSLFKTSGFDDLKEKMLLDNGEDSSDESIELQLSTIIDSSGRLGEEYSEHDDTSERFNSVINFPNFLLHVLRVTTKKDIPLDDKRLIPTFEKHLLKSKGVESKVKEFVFSLLKCKYLFDHYILKREFIKEKDGWSLKQYKWYESGDRRSERANYINSFGEENGDDGINRQILMLLSAFHVSTPTLVYKHWLNAALNWLYDNDVKVKPQFYKNHLESVAKSFVFDRYLSNNPQEYYEMIYKREGSCKSKRSTFTPDKLRNKLTFGKIENNLVFNFLDYLLWLSNKVDNARVNNFEFTFRSSVEHYYPQHPLPGFDKMDIVYLNSFGNLCLISHSKNSRLSHFTPNQKKEYYEKTTIDSIKQYLMMKENVWDEAVIEKHYQQMVKVLLICLPKD